MGVICGKLKEKEEGRIAAYTVVFGTLTSDAEVAHFKKSRCKFRFRMKRGNIVDVETWGESDLFTLMSTLREGDQALICGEYRQDTYESQGQKKTRYYIIAEFVIPFSTIFHALQLSFAPTINRFLADDMKTTADPAEALHTEEDEEYEQYVKAINEEDSDLPF